MLKALPALSSSLSKTTFSDMDCPNSPAELAKDWCLSQLDAMPEGSIVQLSVQQYREMLLDHFQAQELIAYMSNFIEKHVSDN